MKQTITINVDEYHEMKKAYDFLVFIQQYGLENWEGYDLALNLYELLTKMDEE